jgi:uncharacterized membrane protein YfbV (UPF0208 family)
MIEDSIKEINNEKKDKVMIGGNFTRWGGGFQSYVVASQFQYPIYAPTMHNKLEKEECVSNLKHIPHIAWAEWIKELSTFKYAVNMMPTVAAGTFSLNCAYLGIPCIGNKEFDTQNLCFHDLSIDVEDLRSAVQLVKRLKEYPDFYKHVSDKAKENYNKHFSEKIFIQKMEKILK